MIVAVMSQAIKFRNICYTAVYIHHTYCAWHTVLHDILVEDLQEKHSRQNSECKGPEAGTTLLSWRTVRSSVWPGQSERGAMQGLVGHTVLGGV